MRVVSVPQMILNASRFLPSNYTERDLYDDSGVVWGGIMLNGWTVCELHVFDRVSVTGDCYCKEVILPHVRLFPGAIGQDFIFMEKNAWLHTGLLMFSSYWEVKISLERISQRSLLI
ncbi:transposable element Tcb2 transposase [Trichonephila clavipes]|nr:transposable element Tcb2 transposase [Trichonephila clavipes]